MEIIITKARPIQQREIVRPGGKVMMADQQRLRSSGPIRSGLSLMLWGTMALILIGRAGSGAGPDGPGDRNRTGIELMWRSLRATPPVWWDVIDAATRQ